MPSYLYNGATGKRGEVLVIEDPGLVATDETGTPVPGYTFIDATTVRAHPLIIELLIMDSERLWSQEELLASLPAPTRSAARPRSHPPEEER